MEIPTRLGQLTSQYLQLSCWSVSLAKWRATINDYKCLVYYFSLKLNDKIIYYSNTSPRSRWVNCWNWFYDHVYYEFEGGVRFSSKKKIFFNSRLTRMFHLFQTRWYLYTHQSDSRSLCFPYSIHRNQEYLVIPGDSEHAWCQRMGSQCQSDNVLPLTCSNKPLATVN